MKIYIASLSDYNAGIIHGVWFDLSTYSGDLEDLHDDIKKLVLDTSPYAREEGVPAEEWAIHDYDGVYPDGLSEYESLENLLKIQGCLDSCQEDGIDEEAFCEWMEEINGLDYWDFDYDDFKDAYYGQFTSEEDFAYEYVGEMGMLNDAPEFLSRYFDYAAFARDIFIDDFTMTKSGYVFS